MQRCDWFCRLLTEIIDNESLDTLMHIVPKVEQILLAVINVEFTVNCSNYFNCTGLRAEMRQRTSRSSHQIVSFFLFVFFSANSREAFQVLLLVSCIVFLFCFFFFIFLTSDFNCLSEDLVANSCVEQVLSDILAFQRYSCFHTAFMFLLFSLIADLFRCCCFFPLQFAT